ncbi:MAG TPA: hypothetical protein VIT45_12515 [Allosphingosinicella sp.]
MTGSHRRLPLRVLILLGMALPTAALPAFSAAHACVLVTYSPPTPGQKRRSALAEVKYATAIIDGEVVRAATEDRPALVRASRIFKGPRQAFFEIDVKHTGCDFELTRKGSRMRMVLSGGPERYFLSVQSDSRAVDRVLKSDRRKAWPYREGAPQSQEPQ